MKKCYEMVIHAVEPALFMKALYLDMEVKVHWWKSLLRPAKVSAAASHSRLTGTLQKRLPNVFRLTHINPV